MAKDADGTIEAHEIDEADEADEANELVQLESDIAEILAADGVVHLAASMEPGTVVQAAESVSRASR